MKAVALVLVCFIVGFVFVIAASASPFVVCMATLVCVAAYPMVRRFARFVSVCIDARTERSTAIRDYVATVQEMRTKMNGHFPTNPHEENQHVER